MKLIKLFFTAFTAALLSTACTIEQEITFNENMGGTFSVKMDMKDYFEMMSLMGGEDFNLSSLTDSLEYAMSELDVQFDAYEGISNSKSYFDAVESAMIVSYDFAKVENINQLNTTNELLSFTSPTFSMGKSSFSYKLGKVSETMNSEEVALMGDMFKFNIRFNFPEKIKKVSNKAYNITEDGKGVILEATLPQILDHKGKFDVTVNW